MPVNFISERIGHFRLTKGLLLEECGRMANNAKASRIILDEPLHTNDIVLLENEVFSKRSGITLVCYSSFTTDPNLSFLNQMPSVRKISIVIAKPRELEALAELKNLEELTMAAYDIESFDFLALINPGLKELNLHSTISSKPNLKHLGRFSLLKILVIEGHSKYIEEINRLEQLEEITLRSVACKNVDFLKGLSKLWHVDIKLGGMTDFSTLETIPNLTYLELWQIRLLKDLSFISNLYSLQALVLQALRNVEKIPPLERLTKLRRIEMENMKGLTDLHSIITAPALTDFIFRNANKQLPEQLRFILTNKSLETIYCDIGSKRKNDEVDRILLEYGKVNLDGRFIFR